MKLIQKGAAAGIGEGFEDIVHFMQPNGCIFFLPRQIELRRTNKRTSRRLRRTGSGLLQVKRARPEVDDPVVPIENLGTEQANGWRRELKCFMQNAAQIYHANFLTDDVERPDR